MHEIIKNPNGITLVTGPTGSGKTTTLYSTLFQLNNSEVNIMTIEESGGIRRMAGLAQSQVHPDIGYDFNMGLRTALRQDPDIIMVGEIRDQETIEIAIKALTGHMVLLDHPHKFIGFYYHPYSRHRKYKRLKLLPRSDSSKHSVLCVVSVNTAKKNMTQEKKYEDDIRKILDKTHDCDFDYEMVKKEFYLQRPKGCEKKKCNEMGYKGRMGIYELLKIDRILKKWCLMVHENQILKMPPWKRNDYITMDF